MADDISTGCGRESSMLLILNKEQIMSVELPQMLTENFRFHWLFLLALVALGMFVT